MIDQQLLNADSIKAFYHDDFVADQVCDFIEFVPKCGLLVDIGGGVGHFAHAIVTGNVASVRVIDSDPESIAKCHEVGLDAVADNAITTRAADQADVISFNLILHHLVGSGFAETENLQTLALINQRSSSTERRIFVNEYIYESAFYEEFGASFIFFVTSSKLLSIIGKFVARAAPSLQANTFGVGVQFHSVNEWRKIFENAGWKIVQHKRGKEETISIPRRIVFLLKSCRRDSFLLAPIH